ncbi:glucose-methanol-choline oxidoreductase (plasmid) [Rhizobium leguminosarum bv. trifolii WSM2304]|uniref:Glucose-methanol-choline oxidoreductase n=1 Tax=Rhizobium leguminosarum bv. trifolii (strain WSM2304) TaxID=395492 RepID=A0ABF7QZL0_RHILW|nr:choline dehydrogenase [Rhizobium leguminosarum]ACI59693.1 glucose-methanol-choline oxidoreductase [Rhizobium leguminosarum bv. trifolii WSM2304]
MDREFDFIVVGGGSAGCALASRLSENAASTVLLIEAGPDANPWQVRMPLAVDALLTSTKYNWAFQSAAEPGLGGRVIEHPRGRVLGGSSAINGMVYTRGNPQDYDEWRDEHGCRGWGYADVLPYFIRMESTESGDSRYRGRKGPLKVTKPRTKNPLNLAFLAAGEELGYPITDDSNGPQHEGFAIAEQTIVNGQRNSTAAAYLSPAVRSRPNLTIASKTVVERILFEGRRASGVRCQSSEKAEVFKSRREIILSAGGVGSPHILKLSGIGPAAELQEHGIAIVHDLKGVGANLQDHLDLPIQFTCKQPVSLKRSTEWPRKAFVGLNWFLLKGGVAASNQFEVTAYIRSRAGISKPNLKFEFFPLSISHDNFKPYPQEAFQIHCTVETSYARGNLLLKSSNPNEAPSLNFNYLSDERDMQTFREGVGLVRELVASRAFDPYRGTEMDPGEAVKSREALDEWIRRRATTAFHISGTCAMGRQDDPNAVIGPDLKVHGVEGLRVADASIMPVVVTSNLNASAIMIGERAADFTLGRPQLSPSNEPYWVNPNWQTSQR